MCLLLWWHSVKHQQFYRDCLGGSSSRKEDLIACPAIQKKNWFYYSWSQYYSKNKYVKMSYFLEIVGFWWQVFQLLVQLLSPFFPDYFFQIIQTSIFRAWLVRDIMRLQVLDFNKNVGPVLIKQSRRLAHFVSNKVSLHMWIVGYKSHCWADLPLF